MDRAAAKAYLTDEFSDLADDTGLNPANGYEQAIDNALGELGYTDPDTDVPSSQAGDYKALLELYALKRFVKKLAVRTDIALENKAIEKKRSQAFTNAKILLDLAQQEIDRRGFGQQDFEIGRLELDFLEPGF